MLLGPLKTFCLIERLGKKSIVVEADLWREQDLPIESVGILFDLVNHGPGKAAVGGPPVTSPVFIGSVFPNGRKERNLKGWKIIRASFGMGKSIIFSQSCPLNFDLRCELGDKVKEFMGVQRSGRMRIQITRVPEERRVNPVRLEFEVECSYPGLDNGPFLDLHCELV